MRPNFHVTLSRTFRAARRAGTADLYALRLLSPSDWVIWAPARTSSSAHQRPIVHVRAGLRNLASGGLAGSFPVTDRTFVIIFLVPRAHAYAFTFG